LVKIADFGDFKSVSPLVSDVLAGDTVALDRHLAAGWDIDADLELSPHTREPAITLALACRATASVRWLVGQGAELNLPGNPAFATAARYGDSDMLRYLVAHGADVHARMRVGGDAYQQALYGSKLDNLPVIQELGHSVTEHGGEAFRSAVFSRNRRAAESFLAGGVDIDYREPDMVFPNVPTALCVAAYHGDMEMCRFLVEHGADVTIATQEGSRPYIAAVERGNDELAAFFKALEPPEFHDLANKLHELEPYSLPATLIDFLQGDNPRIDLDGSPYGMAFIEFFTLTDTVPIKAGGK
jgi:uncharacterized protein